MKITIEISEENYLYLKKTYLTENGISKQINILINYDRERSKAFDVVMRILELQDKIFNEKNNINDMDYPNIGFNLQSNKE